MHSKRIVDCLPLLVLAIYTLFDHASAIDNRGVEYRRNRSTESNVFLHQEIVVDRANEKKLRRAKSTTTLSSSNNEIVPPTRKVSRNRSRTRGVSGSDKPQNRRELGKSSGKSSGKSGSSGSSWGGGGSGGSGGGGAHSSAGWDSDNGSYCGCLCFSDYDMYGINNQGVSCDFTYDQNSYGFYQSNAYPDNSRSYLPSYFNYNALTEWNAVQDANNYFTEYGYEKQDWQDQEWQTYEGRNGDDDQGNNGENDEENNGDGDQENNGDGDQENNEENAVVVDSLDSGIDPYQAFDIGSCDTYSHLWTYDLLVSCADGNQFCQCTYAKELMLMGVLSCSDMDECPGECEVCSNCMHSICDQSMPSKIVASAARGNAVVTTAAIFGTVLLAFCVALKHDQSVRKGSLNESLMDTDNETSYSSKNWSVPVNENGLPTDEQNSKNKKSKPVWLAPDVSTIPTKPLFPDLLKDADGKQKKSPERRQRQRKSQQQSRSEIEEQDCERIVVEMSKVTSNEGPRTKEKHYPIGPLMLETSNQSIPSSISSDSKSDSGSEDNHDSYGFSQEDKARPDGKSIGTSEGEI